MWWFSIKRIFLSLTDTLEASAKMIGSGFQMGERGLLSPAEDASRELGHPGYADNLSRAWEESGLAQAEQA